MNKKFTLFIFIFFFFNINSVLFSQTKIDINIASLQELKKITGIGPAIGQRIIDARPFYSVNDLLKVKGIGEKTIQKIKEQGFACINCSNYSNQAPSTNNQTNKIVPTKPSLSPAIYQSGVYINEILPNPEGRDEVNEWIEIYNSNDFDINLSCWKLRDTEGSVKTYTFPADTKILANGFLVFKRPDTKIVLNNDKDGLELMNPSGKIVDFLEYKESQLGQSFNRTDSDWKWSSFLTPGAENKFPEALPNSKDSVNLNKGLASLNQEDIKNTNPWFLFFTALILAIFSALFVLFIKLKIKKDVRT
jgi:competence ComEA-like helix-hairpin-helix protein